MKYNILWCSSVQNECLSMTNFVRNLRHLKALQRNCLSNPNKIKQDDCCDPVIVIHVHINNENTWLSSYKSALGFIAQMMVIVGHISLSYNRETVKSMFISCLLLIVLSPGVKGIVCRDVIVFDIMIEKKTLEDISMFIGK